MLSGIWHMQCSAVIPLLFRTIRVQDDFPIPASNLPKADAEDENVEIEEEEADMNIHAHIYV